MVNYHRKVHAPVTPRSRSRRVGRWYNIDGMVEQSIASRQQRLHAAKTTQEQAMVSVSVTTYTFQYIHFIIMTSYHTLIQYSAYKLTECILKIFVPPYSCLTDVSVCGRHHCRGHSHPPHQPPLGGLNVKLLQLKTLSDTYMLSPWFTPHY